MFAKGIVFGAPFVVWVLLMLVLFPLCFFIDNFSDKLLDKILDTYCWLAPKVEFHEGVDYTYATKR